MLIRLDCGAVVLGSASVRPGWFCERADEPLVSDRGDPVGGVTARGALPLTLLPGYALRRWSLRYSSLLKNLFSGDSASVLPPANGNAGRLRRPQGATLQFFNRLIGPVQQTQVSHRQVTSDPATESMRPPPTHIGG